MSIELENIPRPFSVLWRYWDAPEELRNLSPHGGDEDWILYSTADFDAEDYKFEPLVRALGVCDVSRHPLLDGSVVFIGAHA